MLPGRFSRDPKAPGTKENTAAALLLAFTLAAILWANSPWAETLLGAIGHARRLHVR